jgi:hypothetical protein
MWSFMASCVGAILGILVGWKAWNRFFGGQ